MKFSRGHAEFSAGSEAYGDGFACLLPVASRLVGMLQSWYQSIGSKVKSQLHSLESVTAMVGSDCQRMSSVLYGPRRSLNVFGMLSLI